MSEVQERCEHLKKRIELLNENAVATVYDWQFGEACGVDFRDKKLDEGLQQAGQRTGGWSSTGSVNIARDGQVSESDIPVNLQKCREEGTSNIGALYLGDLAKQGCEVYEVHVHDGLGHPTAHLRIRCKDSHYVILNGLANLIAETHKIGRAVCEGIELKDVSGIKV